MDITIDIDDEDLAVLDAAAARRGLAADDLARELIISYAAQPLDRDFQQIELK